MLDYLDKTDAARRRKNHLHNQRIDKIMINIGALFMLGAVIGTIFWRCLT